MLFTQSLVANSQPLLFAKFNKKHSDHLLGKLLTSESKVQQPLLSDISCNKDTQQCLTFGEDVMNNQPFIYKSHDGGQSWQSTALPNNQQNKLLGRIVDVSCHWDIGRCTAIGSNFGFGGELQPFSYQSQDSGTNWQLSALPNDDYLLGNPLLSKIFCDYSHNQCMSIGFDESSASTIFNYLSYNSGYSWQLANTNKDNRSVSEPSSLHCDNTMTHCLTTINDTDDTHQYQTHDAGLTWQLNAAESNIQVIKVSCDNDEQNCYALYRKAHDNTEDYYLKNSQDGGAHWNDGHLIAANQSPVESGQMYYDISDISCDKTADHCIASGAKLKIQAKNNSMSYAPISLSSQDGAQSWSWGFPPLAIDSKNTAFLKVSCDDSATHCLAIAADYGSTIEDSSEPFYLYSYRIICIPIEQPMEARLGSNLHSCLVYKMTGSNVMNLPSNFKSVHLKTKLVIINFQFSGWGSLPDNVHTPST